MKRKIGIGLLVVVAALIVGSVIILLLGQVTSPGMLVGKLVISCTIGITYGLHLIRSDKKSENVEEKRNG